MTTEEKIKVMQAFLDGKEIEFKENYEAYFSLHIGEPKWDWDAYEYRIKEEPKIIPYSYEDDLLGVKISHTGSKYKCIILFQNEDSVCTGNDIYYSYEMLTECFTHLDGTPCGKLSE